MAVRGVDYKAFVVGQVAAVLVGAGAAVVYAWLKAQAAGKPVEISCAIGDGEVDGLPYSLIVALARDYISELGGFEKFAEWGLLRY